MPKKTTKPKPTLVEIHRRANALIDDAAGELRGHVEAALAKAVPAAQAWLSGRLSVVDGLIQPSAARTATMRLLMRQIITGTKRAGLDQQIEDWSLTFGRQMPLFDDVLSLMGLPPMQWGKRDKDWLTNSILSAQDQVKGVIEQAARAVQEQALMQHGAMRLSDLYGAMQTRMAMAPAAAVNVADTSATIFLRSVHERGYARIEETQGEPLRYRFFGPDDKLERPMCHALHQGKAIDRQQGKRRIYAPASTATDGSYTRAEIATMDNGQLPNVLLTGGGYRCRHQWVVASLVPGHVDRAPEDRTSPRIAEGSPDRLARQFADALHDVPTEVARIFGRVPAVPLVERAGEHFGYDHRARHIVFDPSRAIDPSRAVDALRHEFFHHADWSLGRGGYALSMDRDAAIGRALVDETKRLSDREIQQRLKAAMRRGPDLYRDDLYAALTMGRIGDRRPAGYWLDDADRRFREAFANLGTLYSRADRSMWEWVLRESEEVAATFESWLKGL